ncbi:MAG: glutaredoxin family protein [Nitrospirota bacterium]|jgi:glutaredoxin
MVKITFYYKEGCWLCDTAEETLGGLAERHGLRIRKVDIESDPELYELYRFDIPVLEFGDGSTLNGRIRKKDLLRKFGENRERPGPPQSMK